MKRVDFFILAVCLLIGITNGQQGDDWFSKLLNQPQAPVSNSLLVQQRAPIMQQQPVPIMQQLPVPIMQHQNIPIVQHQQIPIVQQQQQQQTKRLLQPVQSTRVAAPPPTFKELQDGMPNVILGCWTNPCLNGATCIDLTDNQNGFQCQCAPGFVGDRCERLLEIPSPIPSPSQIPIPTFEQTTGICANNPCLNGGSCKEFEDGTFSCNCMKPWAGSTCNEVWKNPCTEEALRNLQVQQFKNPWDRNSFLICLDVNVHHSMRCSVGTYFNENLRHCVPEGFEPPKCPTGYCLNDGECMVDSSNLLRCVCQKGFSGERCQVNIDECALEGNAACQGGMCVDQINGFYCKCPGDKIGVNCQQTIENPCTDSNIANKLQFFELPTWNHNIYLQCTSLLEFTVRKCADNLFWNAEEETCTAERPRVRGGICLTLPCKNGGECVSGGEHGFMCKCKRGFTGVTCEDMIDNCASNPCQNGGTCVSFAGGYTCMCPNKVVDECCCHDTQNPCPPRRKIIPGVNNYFKHSLLNRYIHCDFEGRAFVRSCAAGTNWNQKVLTCTPDSFYTLNKVDSVSTSPAVGGYGNSMHSNLLPIEKALLPSNIVPSRSFAEYQQTRAALPGPSTAVNAPPVASYQVPVVQQAAPVAPTYQATPQVEVKQAIDPVVPQYQQYQEPIVQQQPQYQAVPPMEVKEASAPVVPQYQQYQEPQEPIVQQPIVQQQSQYQQYQQPQEPIVQQPIVQQQPQYQQYQQPTTYSSGDRAYKLRARFNHY